MNERRSLKKKLKSRKTIYTLRLLTVAMMLTAGTVYVRAQDDVAPADSVVKAAVTPVDAGAVAATPGDAAGAAANVTPSGTVDARTGLPAMTADSILAVSETSAETDTASVSVMAKGRKRKQPKAPRDWATWKPDPQRAMWLAMVLPGAGQIYNRKYWKLPIFYGGMMGCLYAMNWNNMMYKDYSQAYLDIMDDDPATQSYNTFLHLGRKIDASNEERYKKLFKSRKDKYRRWRDMSFFCLIGVYALSVIDAYVDAELSQFDISKDLSLRVEPAVINGWKQGNSLDAAALGLQCSLVF